MTGEKDTFSEEIVCPRDEMIRDKARKAVAENAGNVRKSLEGIGVTRFDDHFPSEQDEVKPPGLHRKFSFEYSDYLRRQHGTVTGP